MGDRRRNNNRPGRYISNPTFISRLFFNYGMTVFTSRSFAPRGVLAINLSRPRFAADVLRAHPPSWPSRQFARPYEYNISRSCAMSGFGYRKPNLGSRLPHLRLVLVPKSEFETYCSANTLCIWYCILVRIVLLKASQLRDRSC